MAADPVMVATRPSADSVTLPAARPEVPNTAASVAVTTAVTRSPTFASVTTAWANGVKAMPALAAWPVGMPDTASATSAGPSTRIVVDAVSVPALAARDSVAVSRDWIAVAGEAGVNCT